MKRFLPLILISIVFASCQEDVRFNTPGFQGLKDDVFWRSNDTRAYISSTGQLTIEALTPFEEITLSTSSANVGTFILGTTNVNNSATYSSSFNDVLLEYGTVAVPGPVSGVSLNNSGTGYSSGTAVATTGGSGSGLTVNVVANASGVVTSVSISSRGNAYLAGDIVTVAAGNLNCRIRILNTLSSNGEIQITEYDNVNMTVTGKFKFNAANTNNSPFGASVVNFQFGEFYKIPIFPSM